MMRRVADRLRASWTTQLRGELEGVRDELTTSFESSLEDLRHDIVVDRDIVDARAAEHDTHLASALQRVADAFESIAESYAIDRRDRAQQLEAVEFLLREMVLGLAQPTALPPVVLGGSIEPGVPGSRPLRAVDIDLTDSRITTGAPIPNNAPVEVRSRFHDRWIHGFAIAEYVVGADRSGYRLRRLSESEQLPLLFDVADVRPATHASDLPIPTPGDDPNHSMWR
jgi:hypothetical protein